MFEKSEKFNELCLKLLGQDFVFNKLSGGINNPTYLIKNKKNRYVLKKINTEPTINFNRYMAEKQFLNLSNNICEVKTPKLIDYYDNERILILEYIEPDEINYFIEIDHTQIIDCIKFISQINSNKNLGQRIVKQRAADCYLDLTGHIDNINKRILKFETQHISKHHRDSAVNLLILLKNKWKNLQKETFDFIEKNPNQNSIDPYFLIISPSDFGFHNIVVNNGINYFLDFEFSGWDDPAKLYCDFILQPKFPIPYTFHKLLKERLINKDYIYLYEKRINILYKLLEFKWHTIKYSFFNENKYSTNQFNKDNLMNINLKDYINEIY